MAFFDWIQSNFGMLTDTILALMVFLVALAKLTPTPKDDEWFARILAYLNLLPHSARAKLAEAEAAKAKAKAAEAAKK